MDEGGTRGEGICKRRGVRNRTVGLPERIALNECAQSWPVPPGGWITMALNYFDPPLLS